jgi:exopolysaccharide biosynthesis polyprenyl glycosylphosphotransferase
MVPRSFEILVAGLHASSIGNVPVLGVEALPLQDVANQIVKRTVDIIGGAVGLFLAAPIIAICGAIVYIESPGSIFYRQIRTGINGRPFTMIKIRSMRLDAEANGVQWASKDDHRRLRIGAFMRKWNLDEVPQFWNVLNGEMSLVGPRPERPELIEQFKYKISHYNARHTCKPGMTGWAQVNGWRGNTDLEERIRHDIWYVENWDLWLDFKIMFMTLVKQDNAY